MNALTGEHKRFERWARPFLVFGTNALAVYFLSEFVVLLASLVRFKRPGGDETDLLGLIYEKVFAPSRCTVHGSRLFMIHGSLTLGLYLCALARSFGGCRRCAMKRAVFVSCRKLAAPAFAVAAMILAMQISGAAQGGPGTLPINPRIDSEAARIRDEQQREMQLRNVGESEGARTDERAVRAAAK